MCLTNQSSKPRNPILKSVGFTTSDVDNILGYLTNKKASYSFEWESNGVKFGGFLLGDGVINNKIQSRDTNLFL